MDDFFWIDGSYAAALSTKTYDQGGGVFFSRIMMQYCLFYEGFFRTISKEFNYKLGSNNYDTLKEEKTYA